MGIWTAKYEAKIRALSTKMHQKFASQYQKKYSKRL